jgi:hypothetical protein
MAKKCALKNTEIFYGEKCGNLFITQGHGLKKIN